MNILFKNALIVSVDETRPPFFRGDLMVSGTRISALAALPERLEAGAAERVIECDRLLLMPGLINTHGHAAMTLFRSVADDMPLIDWLEQKIFPLEDRLVGDDVYWGTMLAIVEMLKGGTTTFTDMYVFTERVAEAAAGSGVRAVLARGMGGSESKNARQLAESEQLIKNWHGACDGRITVSIGPHAPYSCSPAFLKQTSELAAREGLLLQIHLSETAGEVEQSLLEHGKSPVRLVDELGLFEQKTIAAHCVHLDDGDIAILAQKGVGVSHNPGSNLKLGCGMAPLNKLLGAGVKIGLGTDGAASNNNLDLWEELRLAALLAKGVEQDPAVVPAMTALRMATIDGASLLGLTGTGMIREGYSADLIGISLDSSRMTPPHNPVANLVYSASAGDVKLVMVAGEILVEGGELTRLDEQEIAAEASRRALRLTESSK